jgi:hypothetical protein
MLRRLRRRVPGHNDKPDRHTNVSSSILSESWSTPPPCSLARTPLPRVSDAVHLTSMQEQPVLYLRSPRFELNNGFCFQPCRVCLLASPFAGRRPHPEPTWASGAPTSHLRVASTRQAAQTPQCPHRRASNSAPPRLRRAMQARRATQCRIAGSWRRLPKAFSAPPQAAYSSARGGDSSVRVRDTRCCGQSASV